MTYSLVLGLIERCMYYIRFAEITLVRRLLQRTKVTFSLFKSGDLNFRLICHGSAQNYGQCRYAGFSYSALLFTCVLLQVARLNFLENFPDSFLYYGASDHHIH